MTETVRCWLVDRTVADGRMLTLTYTTEDATRVVRRQVNVTNADDVDETIEVEPDRLEAVTDEAQREVYLDALGRQEA